MTPVVTPTVGVGGVTVGVGTVADGVETVATGVETVATGVETVADGVETCVVIAETVVLTVAGKVSPGSVGDGGVPIVGATPGATPGAGPTGEVEAGRPVVTVSPPAAGALGVGCGRCCGGAPGARVPGC